MSIDPVPVGATPEAVQPAQSRYRLRRPLERRALLRQCVETGVALTLTGPGTPAYTTLLWAEDAERDLVVFAADPADPRVQALLAANRALAVGWLDQVQIQFELHGLLLVHGREASALQAVYPDVVYRFQRRDSFRVRPLGISQPRVRLGAPREEVPPLTLRVLDLSHGGVALALHEAVPALSIGRVLPRVLLELDAATRLTVQLRVVHIAPLAAGANTAPGWRLGCELGLGDALSVRQLQAYLDGTQRLRRELAI